MYLTVAVIFSHQLGVFSQYCLGEVDFSVTRACTLLGIIMERRVSQDDGKLVFGISSRVFILSTINEAHKESNLSDTTFNYNFHFAPPGRHLYNTKSTTCWLVSPADM